MPQLRLASQTARSDARSIPQIRQRGAYQAIAYVIAPAYGWKHKPRRNIGRHIFYAVHRQVDRFLQQRILQFLDKYSLAANLRQRCVLHLVAACFDDHNFRFHARRDKQVFAHEFRLPLGKHAATRADAQDSHGFSLFERNTSRSASTF